LGPGTIVGSAAFNLFVIIAICIYVIPSDEVRQVKHLRVFFVTASWSVLAYVWLYLIIAHISPGEVEVPKSSLFLTLKCLVLRYTILVDVFSFQMMANFDMKLSSIHAMLSKRSQLHILVILMYSRPLAGS